MTFLFLTNSNDNIFARLAENEATEYGTVQ